MPDELADTIAAALQCADPQTVASIVLRGAQLARDVERAGNGDIVLAGRLLDEIERLIGSSARGG